MPFKSVENTDSASAELQQVQPNGESIATLGHTELLNFGSSSSLMLAWRGQCSEKTTLNFTVFAVDIAEISEKCPCLCLSRLLTSPP